LFLRHSGRWGSPATRPLDTSGNIRLEYERHIGTGKPHNNGADLFGSERALRKNSPQRGVTYSGVPDGGVSAASSMAHVLFYLFILVTTTFHTLAARTFRSVDFRFFGLPRFFRLVPTNNFQILASMEPFE
jgi:hypothetical protein